MELSDVLSQEQISTERRGQTRFACDHPAFLTSAPDTEQLAVRIRNVSKGGLGLRVPGFLPIGTLVELHLKHSVAQAVVRYCVRVGTGFHAGVQVESITPRQ